MLSETWMKAALEQGKEALDNGEVPIGCVFVYKDEIISRGRNTVNETKNATRHAEFNALNSLFEWGDQRNIPHRQLLKNSTLYVTVEPCIMCAEALGQLNLGKLVFGCSNDRFGGCGSVYDVLKYYKGMEVVKGVRGADAVGLLKEFYKGENPNAPTGKAKRKISKSQEL
ncbi:UNVERIFIED_CONTAM: hypothetical protein GTU68_022443 [Idotea baltica]|nr:hypothetical protein [Idotea baltica]